MSGSLSGIDRDIFQHQLNGIAEEMSRALRRSAYSSIIWDMYDYACGMFTVDGEMLGQSETVAAQLGTMSSALRYMLSVVPLSTWREGDVLICNDPYKGCTHTPDITLFSPVFFEGEIIAVTSTIAHHIDIGGRFPSTTVIDNVEVFAEGLIFPPVRLIEMGKPNETVHAFIRSNVRYPDVCMGDLRAQVAGCHTAERRLGELAARYGRAGFDYLVQEVLNYGERYTRTVIGKLPTGVYQAETLIEDGVASDEFIRVAVSVHIGEGQIAIDFTGSSDQRACALNCPLSSTESMATYAIKCLLTPELSQNGGCDRVVSINAPSGSVLNPRRPAAVGVRHYVQQAVADVILKALAAILPDRSAAGSQISFPIFRAGGLDSRPGAIRRAQSAGQKGGDEAGTATPYVIMDILGGGMGGSSMADGLSAVDTHGGNCGLLSAEVMEVLSPVRVTRSAVVAGSGGEGQYRGGLAIERCYEFLTEGSLGAVRLQQYHDATAPWGARGGANGGKAIVLLNPGTADEAPLPMAVGRVAFKAGDRVLVRSAGGGGYGDPGHRDDAAVSVDRQQGYI